MRVAIVYFLLDCAAPLAGDVRAARGEQDGMLSGLVSRRQAMRASGNGRDVTVGDREVVGGGGQTAEVKRPRTLLSSGTWV